METPAGSGVPNAGNAALDAVLESAHEAFISMDDDGRIVAWNREAERTFGWSRQAAVGSVLRDLIIPPRYRERHDAGLRRFRETGEGPLLGKRIEITALHRSGHEFPVELAISALRADGRWRFHAFVHDISDRYRLHEVQARLATLVEHSADAIVSRTLDGVVTSWNPGAEELFGYSADEMMGRTLDRLVPPDREGEVKRRLRDVVAGRAVRSFETQRVRKDGTVIDVSVSISPIRDDAGAINEVSLIARDITERKRSERALEHALAELERANELKSRFVAIASHELRTPLTSIMGFASTLVHRWERLSEDQRLSFIAVVERQAQRLQRVVQDLLTLSRIEAGRIPLAADAVDLAAVARRAVEELQLGAETTVSGSGRACVDPDHAHQMLSNLLTNARAHGKPPFAVHVDGRGDETVVCVSDAGPGVPPEFAPYLFETFTQARPSSVTGGGTGLGLAIIAGLAAAAGGRAWFEPGEPRGARFCVALPPA